MELNEINDKTLEGRMLAMAVAALTVSPAIHIGGDELNGRNLTPSQVLDLIKKVTDEVYKDRPIEPLRAAADPLIKYLAENHHPHVTAIVTGIGAEILEGIKSTGQVMDYIKD